MTCNGKGKLPCPSCGGSGQTLTLSNRPITCIVCKGKRVASTCPGCPACKKTNTNHQGRLSL